jgi:hypothetical protein
LKTSGDREKRIPEKPDGGALLSGRGFFKPVLKDNIMLRIALVLVVDVM